MLKTNWFYHPGDEFPYTEEILFSLCRQIAMRVYNNVVCVKEWGSSI